MSIVIQLPQAPGLGRHINHDSRSASYALPVMPKSAIKSQHWGRTVPIFDQGQTGSCTGNAATGWLVTNSLTRPGLQKLADGTPLDERFAREVIYHAATQIDPFTGEYPPDDTGSDGLSVSKVLKAMGLCGDYYHGFSVDAIYSALQTGPGYVGVVWDNSMFDTDASGHIKMDVRSGVAGGHEILVTELDVTSTGVVERVWIDNSWGEGWAYDGRGYWTDAEFRGLMARQGDFCQPHPVTAPTPPPQPPASDMLSFLDQDVHMRVNHAADSAKMTSTAWVNRRLKNYFRL